MYSGSHGAQDRGGGYSRTVQSEATQGGYLRDSHSLRDGNIHTSGMQVLSAAKSEKFLVPSSICGGLIGRGGENIHKLGGEFAVHIDISKPVSADGMREVTVNALDAREPGAEANVQRCKQRILQNVQQLMSSI